MRNEQPPLRIKGEVINTPLSGGDVDLLPALHIELNNLAAAAERRHEAPARMVFDRRGPLVRLELEDEIGLAAIEREPHDPARPDQHEIEEPVRPHGAGVREIDALDQAPRRAAVGEELEDAAGGAALIHEDPVVMD